MTGTVMIVLVILVLSIAIILFLRSMWTTYIIFDYERGVKFDKGMYTDVIGPGKYTFLDSTTRIDCFDLRPSLLQLNGQELLSADNVSLKLSLVIKYQITNPLELVTNYENYHDYLYTSAQLKIRELISSISLEEILSNRKVLNDNLNENIINNLSMTGLTIQSIDIKDIMLSSELKKVYMEAIKVKKEALVSLEKARGEMATLRSLANAAKMLEKNPELMKLRLIQTMESSQGNTFVIDTNNHNSQIKA